MIRINLLPQKRAGRGAPEASQKWLLGVLVVVLLQVVGLFLFHDWKTEELTVQNQKNSELQAKINEIKALVANHEAVKKELAVLRQREDAIAKLQSARSGPTAVLLELSRIVTQNRGPTVDADRVAALRKENPLAVFSASWDTRRIWLTSYTEVDRVVKIEGFARDGNDVSELAQRLRLSVYFYEVTILPGKKELEPETKLELIKFALQLKVRY
ncbi:MAG: PilN domain-containing protein [Polyangiaceae bacterium]|nr:PilN domain-containing protein [Polyangiaceae bacterium]